MAEFNMLVNVSLVASYFLFDAEPKSLLIVCCKFNLYVKMLNFGINTFSFLSF